MLWQDSVVFSVLSMVLDMVEVGLLWCVDFLVA